MSPDLDARVSEDVDKGARAIGEMVAGSVLRNAGIRTATARAVLSAANHAELLAERERARVWIGCAVGEMTAEQITRVMARASSLETNTEDGGRDD
jgi:uncharacterized protein YgbK (DUF1537 family)